jgi:hypothetical protein
MGTFAVTNNESWEDIAKDVDVPLPALLSANGLSSDASNSSPPQGSIVFYPDPIEVTVAPENHHIVQSPANPDYAQAALLATGNTLVFALSPEAGFLRSLYNSCAANIAAKRAELLPDIASGAKTEEQVAKILSQMRTEHALHVRQVGSWLSRNAAELFDKVRGNNARPTYESLRALGKTDAQIIESASKTNGFVNALPKGLRWTGGAFWILSIGFSVALVIMADPSEKQKVLQREMDGTLGGALGGLVITGLFLAVGAATGGAAYVVLVFVGSAGGSFVAQKISLTQLLDIAPHQSADQIGRIFYVEGDWSEIDLFIFSIPTKSVARTDGYLVTATGLVSGEMIGGRGHYRMLEVVPSSPAAVTLFVQDSGGSDARWVPQFLLHEAEDEDFRRQTDV